MLWQIITITDKKSDRIIRQTLGRKNSSQSRFFFFANLSRQFSNILRNYDSNPLQSANKKAGSRAGKYFPAVLAAFAFITDICSIKSLLNLMLQAARKNVCIFSVNEHALKKLTADGSISRHPLSAFASLIDFLQFTYRTYPLDSDRTDCRQA